ncbi:MAG: HAD hydrolase-like protein [Alphaproteobacteria bacterium]|nr:HAD hydrolase-like protein [Alphaproteobacteria bacterium]
MNKNATWAFRRYEEIRTRLPRGARFPAAPVNVPHLGALTDDFEAFVFDSFGVLNVGGQAIPGAADRLAALRTAGKQIVVLTNAATTPLRDNVAKYRGLGFDFAASEIVSSRAVLADALRETDPDWTWAVAANADADVDELPVRTVPMSGDGEWMEADGFILLSSGGWSNAVMDAVTQALAARPRPVWVGNPDLVAPFEGGFYEQPGSFAHDLADRLGIEPVFFGKPFGNAFDMVHRLLPAGCDPGQVLMLGDTLHTDILGGAAAGFKTGLVTDHGVMKTLDVDACCAASGIVPDYILPAI